MRAWCWRGARVGWVRPSAWPVCMVAARAWRASPGAGASAPVTVIPGVVFMAASTGTVYAYASGSGKAIWSFESAKPFETVNKVEAKGGNINAAGPVVADGMLFVTSGYSDLGGGTRGNVLLAFGVK